MSRLPRILPLLVSASLVGFGSLAFAITYKAPDLFVLGLWGPQFDKFGRLVRLEAPLEDLERMRNGDCNTLGGYVKNGSNIAAAKSFDVVIFLGKRRGTGYVHYTGGRYKQTFNGLPAGATRKFTIHKFKITTALKGQSVFIVAQVDWRGKITEQNETNNQIGFPLSDEVLDASPPCP